MKLRALLLIGFLLAATSAQAHEKMTLAGTVTKRTADTFDVKTTKGQTYTLTTGAITRVIVGDQRLRFDSLKVGQAVTIEGFGDSIESLMAMRIVVAGK